MHTPYFPQWRPRLVPLGRGLRPRLRQFCAYTLGQLESCFEPWLPQDLLPKGEANSRQRIYTAQRTFWLMLWQCFHPGAPGREVVRQLQALFGLEGRAPISAEDGGYCRAKARLPLTQLPQALRATADAAERLVGLASNFLQGRRLWAVDGSTLTLADTPKNRRAYPPLQCPQIPSFPMMRIVGLFCMAAGGIAAMAEGSLATSELSLLASLMSQFNRGDILVGDRAFGCYPLIGWLHSQGIDFIGRTTRRIDGRRRLQRLTSNDWLVLWKKGADTSPWLTAEQWGQLASQLTLRVVKGRCHRKGFRVRQVTVVTTLLDAQRYPAQEILEAYLRRWRLEMCLDDLKTTLQMEMLRGRTPNMARKEAYIRLIAHNFIRCVMAEAAARQEVALERISFKGSLDALRHFSQAMARCRTKKKRRQLWEQLLQTLAADLVPPRPGRREPRAVKRKKNKYPRLNAPRRKFQDHPKRAVRRKLARLRRLGLM